MKFLLPLIFSLIAVTIYEGAFAQSWSEVKKNRKGKLTAYWYESRPFIYKTPSGMEGIEVQLLHSFQKYLKTEREIELEIEWVQGKSFGDIYARIRDDRKAGTIAVSAFSVTPERELDVDFSPSYMSDISVLITSKGVPIVQSREEFLRVFSKLTAITIKSTTYESDILRLKNDGSLPFRTHYIPSEDNILEAVAARDSAFGFIDLPVYMMMFSENPSMNVRRQNLFPVKRKGYAMIYPEGSDWSEPFTNYFQSAFFKNDVESSVSKYIDKELYDFIESLAIQSNDLVVLLTKEKEIQRQDLVGKSEQIIRETRARNFLIVLVAITAVSLIITLRLYVKRSQQKRQIERQRISIENSNQQLERRNQELLMLNEEKNNLVKILAHDLRTPINHIQGLAQIFMLTNESMPEDQKMIIDRISDAAIRLSKMITVILDIDSLENNRVEMQLESIDLHRLLVKVIRSFSEEAANKNIQIRYEESSTALLFRGNTLFTIQIFENLISNAIKFSPKGQKVEIRVDTKDEVFQVHVKDHGPGFTLHDRGLVFKKFQRLSAKPTNGEHSTGLGLSIVKKYTELMEGDVWLEPGTGQGAEFVVELPKATLDEQVGL